MYMFKEVDQPRAEVSPGSLAAAEERVEHRRIFSGIIIATEQVITSAARDRPHFIFYLVIIRSVTTVQMVPGEFVEPSVCIFYGFPIGLSFITLGYSLTSHFSKRTSMGYARRALSSALCS